jgi:hypothetical protein
MRQTRLLCLILLSAVACWSQTAPDCSLVPGWKQHGPVRSYVADNLFDYMNGNAEGYLIYQFVRMQGVTCRSGEKSILIDVSEMANPESAYGIFCANRDPRLTAEKIGMNGQIQPRRAIFAKGKYFVEFAANPAGDHVAALRAFATAMEKRVPGTTELPETVGWFPAEKLVPGSVRLVPQSVLGMSVLKRGYVAEYEFGKACIVTEASPEAAAAVMGKLKARMGQTEAAVVADEGFQANSRYLGRVSFFRKGRYIGGFANLAEGQDPAALSKMLAARIP